MVTFPMTLTDPNSVFKVMTLFEVEYVEVEYVTNGARYRLFYDYDYE